MRRSLKYKIHGISKTICWIKLYKTHVYLYTHREIIISLCNSLKMKELDLSIIKVYLDSRVLVILTYHF